MGGGRAVVLCGACGARSRRIRHTGRLQQRGVGFEVFVLAGCDGERGGGGGVRQKWAAEDAAQRGFEEEQKDGRRLSGAEESVAGRLWQTTV
jgi:hypothetical protein